MTMVYSCICFPLQLLGEDTQGKHDQWEEGRRKGYSEDLVQMQWFFFKPLFPESSETQPFPRRVLWKPGSLLSEQCTPDETSACRCCFCASACLVGWKVEERMEPLLSGGGFCAKGPYQGNGCPLAEDILSYWCFHRQIAVNCRGVWDRKVHRQRCHLWRFKGKPKWRAGGCRHCNISWGIDKTVAWPISVYDYRCLC